MASFRANKLWSQRDWSPECVCCVRLTGTALRLGSEQLAPFFWFSFSSVIEQVVCVLADAGPASSSFLRGGDFFGEM